MNTENTDWKDKIKKGSLWLSNPQAGIYEYFIRTEYVEKIIESLLKEQREICAKEYELYNCLKDSERYIKDRILNAPEPGAKK